MLELAAGGAGRRVTNVGGAAGRRELTERLVFFDGAARFRAAPGKTEAEAGERIRTFYEAGLANLPKIFGTP